jgi:hypothetical protein
MRPIRLNKLPESADRRPCPNASAGNVRNGNGNCADNHAERPADENGHKICFVQCMGVIAKQLGGFFRCFFVADELFSFENSRHAG